MGKSLAKIEEIGRVSLLRLAITNNDVGELYKLIEEERGLLDRLSKHPFSDTPLHIAAISGQTDMAMEMVILKPSFARKLNAKGYSPMHLALENKHYGTVRTLMAIDPNLIRVRGQRGITPLHYVAGKEGDIELELLDEFLYTCHSSIKDLTNRCETTVHLAVKNHNIEAVKVLLGWLKQASLTEILNWKDHNGNTVLHIAILEKQPEIIKLLIGYVKVNAKNFQDKTALEIFQANPSGDQHLAKRFNCASASRPSTPNLSPSFLSMVMTCQENILSYVFLQDETARTITTTVATLVATATYQAMLTSPGGYWQDNSSNPPVNSTDVAANCSGIPIERPHKAGEIILSGMKLHAFVFVNTTAFFVSILMIWITSIPLWPRTLPLYILILYFTLAYSITLSTGFPESDAGGKFSVILCLCWLSIIIIVPRFSVITYRRRRRRIDVPRIHVATSKE